MKKSNEERVRIGIFGKKATIVTAVVLAAALIVALASGLISGSVLKASAATGTIESVTGENYLPEHYSAVNVPAGTRIIDENGQLKTSSDGLAVFDFHIFAENFASTIHTCGNIAVSNLGKPTLNNSGAPEFGSRPNHDPASIKLSYIQHVHDWSSSANADAFVFGSGVEVGGNGGQVFINAENGKRFMMGNGTQYTDKTFIEENTASNPFINIQAELKEAEGYQRFLVWLGENESNAASVNESVTILDGSDFSGPSFFGRNFDLRQYKTDTVIINLTADEATRLIAGSVNITGTSGKRVIFNIDTTGKSEVKFKDTNMRADKLTNSESSVEQDNNILWSFYQKNGNKVESSDSKITVGGTWMGTILAPDAGVVCKAGLNGSIIAKDVTSYCETHKSDYTGEKSVGDTLNLVVNKKWIDDPSTRPEFITVKLLRDGKDYRTVQISGTGNTWQYEFKELPKYDAAGNTYQYKIAEVKVAGYKTNIMNYDITNVSEGGAPEGGVVEKYSLTVTKQDDNNHALAGAQMKLTGAGGINLSGAEVANAGSFKVTDKEITWTTGSNAVVISNLPAGRYIVTEVSAPAGYRNSGETKEITLPVSGGNASVTVTNSVNNVTFAKLDKQNNTRLFGAELQLASANGADVSGIEISGGNNVQKTNGVIRWKSTGTDVTFSKIPAGTYTITETKAPDNYDIAAPVTFTVDQYGKVTTSDGRQVVRVDMFDERKPEKVVSQNITFDKFAEDGTTHLSGAKFILTNAAGKDIRGLANTITGAANVRTTDKENEIEFTTTNEQVRINGILAGGYMLTETEAPTGYKRANPLSFTVSNDENYSLTDNYRIINEPIKLTVCKKDASSGAELSGALLELRGANGSVYGGEWTTDGTARVFSGIPAGTYTLVEKNAPGGYEKAANVTIVIDEYGRVSVNSADASVSGSTVTMFDQPHVISIAKTVKNGNKYTALSGARLQLKALSVNPSTNEAVTPANLTNVVGTIEVTHLGTDTITWQSGAEENSLRGIPDGWYEITELEAPEGYKEFGTAQICVSGGKIVSRIAVSPTKEENVSFNDSELTLVDEKRVFLPVAFSKIEEGTESDPKYLKGAKLSIHPYSETNENTEPIVAFGTEDKPTKIMLEAGRYYLTEDIAPEGYERNEGRVYFEVNDSGEIIKDSENTALSECVYTADIGSSEKGFPTSVDYALPSDYYCSSLTVFKVNGSEKTEVYSANPSVNDSSVSLAGFTGYDANSQYTAEISVKRKDGEPFNPQDSGLTNVALTYNYPGSASGGAGGTGAGTRYEFTGNTLTLTEEEIPNTNGVFPETITLRFLDEGGNVINNGIVISNFWFKIEGVGQSGKTILREWQPSHGTQYNGLIPVEGGVLTFGAGNDLPDSMVLDKNNYNPGDTYSKYLFSGGLLPALESGSSGTLPKYFTVNSEGTGGSTAPSPDSVNAALKESTPIGSVDLKDGNVNVVNVMFPNKEKSAQAEIPEAKLYSVTMTKTDGTGAITGNPAYFILMDEEGRLVSLEGGNGSYAYNPSGTVSELVTDSEGKITVTGLTKGTYTFHENTAPDGYLIGENDNTEFTFTDDDTGNHKEISIANAPAPVRTGEIMLIKTDDKGIPKEGAGFDLYRIALANIDSGAIAAINSGNYSGAKKIQVKDEQGENAEIITKDNGRFTATELEAGYLYFFVEAKAPAGTVSSGEGSVYPTYTSSKYQINGENVGFGVVIAPETQNVKIYDEDSSLYVDFGCYEGIVNVTNESTSLTVNKIAGNAALEGAVLRISTAASTGGYKPILNGVSASLETAHTVERSTENTGTEDEPAYRITDEYIEWTTGTAANKIFGLPVGNYILSEISAPDGYMLAEDVAFTVNSDGTVAVGKENVNGNEITLIDQPYHGTVTLIKLDDANETVSGVGFTLQKSTNGITWVDVENYTTNGEGKVFVENLDYHSRYRFVEKTTKVGYVEANNQTSEVISFTAETLEQTVEVRNTRKTGTITLTKTDGESNAVKDAEFELYYAPTPANGDEPTAFVLYGDGYKTDGDGKIAASGLPWGYTYKFKETAAPEKYVLPTGEAAFTATDYLTAEKLTGEISFTNSEKTCSVQLGATKTIDGSLPGNDQVFDFVVTDKDNNIAAEAQNVGGAVTFPPITYNFSDLDAIIGSYSSKEFVYTVSEKPYSKDGITSDNAIYTVKVTVTKAEDGTLSAAVTEVKKNNVTVEDKSIAFENHYNVSHVTAEVYGKKVLNGRPLMPGEFTFDIYKAEYSNGVYTEGEKLNPSINDLTDDEGADKVYDGFRFARTFTEQPSADGYTYYIIKENIPEDKKGVTYDTTEYLWTLKVVDNGSGALTVSENTVSRLNADGTVNTDSGEDTEIVFTNSYAAEPIRVPFRVEKRLTGRKLASTDRFTFELRRASYDKEAEKFSYDKESEVIDSVTLNGTDGRAAADGVESVSFDLWTEELDGKSDTYAYVITEVIPTDEDGTEIGVKDGVTYDEYGKFVRFHLADDFEGNLLIPTDLENKTRVFTNTFTPTPIKAEIPGTKTLENGVLRDNQFSFEVWKSDENGSAIGDSYVCIAGCSAEGGFTLETDGLESAGEYYYLIKETVGTSSSVSYDTTEYLWKITVTDDNGVLSSSSVLSLKDSGEEVNALRFINTVHGKDVYLSKKAVSGDDELVGAKLTLAPITAGVDLSNVVLPAGAAKNNGVISWISGTVPTKIGMLPDGVYAFTETQAPDGYTVAETICIKVENGNVYSVKASDYKTDGSTNWGSPMNGDKVVMFDETTKVYISKVEMGGGEELPGATLTITDSDGEKVAEWVSTEKAHIIEKLPVGSYTLTETTAPNGYLTTEAIVFTVNEDGTVSVGGKVVDGNTVEMEDAPTNLVISKKAVGGGSELEGAALKITPVDNKISLSDVRAPESVKVEKNAITWTSGKEAVVIERLPIGVYEFTEITAPEGYEVAETIYINITDDGVYSVPKADYKSDGSTRWGKAVKDDTVIMFDAAKNLPTEPKTGSFSFTKGSNINQAVSGAVFSLTKSGYAKTAISANDGKVTFADVPEGIYTLAESSAPYGFTKTENKVSVIISADGAVTFNNTSGTTLQITDVEKLMVNNVVPVKENKTITVSDNINLYDELVRNNPVIEKVPVKWVSSDPTVAEVDANGKVTIKKPGQVTITAKNGDTVVGSFVLGAADKVTNVTAPATIPTTAPQSINVPSTNDYDTPRTGDRVAKIASLAVAALAVFGVAAKVTFDAVGKKRRQGEDA